MRSNLSAIGAALRLTSRLRIDSQPKQCIRKMHLLCRRLQVKVSEVTLWRDALGVPRSVAEMDIFLVMTLSPPAFIASPERVWILCDGLTSSA